MDPSPHIGTGRPLPPGATQLGLDDYRTLLAAMRGLPLRTLPEATHGSGVALRLDAASGLLENISGLREAERAAGVSSFLSISAFAAGDLTFAKEGMVHVDPRLYPLLKTLAGGQPIGLLNELPDAFLASGRTPWTVMHELAKAVAAQGVAVAGTVTPHGEEAATELALLLEHYGMFDWAPEWFFEPYGLHARELIDVAPTPIDKLPCFDSFASLRIGAKTRPAVFSRRLRRPVGQRPAVTRHYGATHVILSSPQGWRLISDGGEQPLDTPDVVALLKAEAKRTEILIICRPDHFSGKRDVQRPAPGTLRDLPAPFDSYLSLSSDVDWSTPGKVAAYQHYLNEELGLPAAGSFFLSGSHARWLAAFDRRGSRRPRENGISVESLAANGAIDTFHHWTNGIFFAELEADGNRYKSKRPLLLNWGRGFAVLSQRAAVTSVTLQAPGLKPRAVKAARQSERPDGNGFYQSFLSLPEDLQDSATDDWQVTLPAEGSGARVVLTDFDPIACAAMIEQLGARGVHPAIYNPHGNNARDVGNLRGTGRSARQADAIVLDMDEPASVFHLFGSLWQLGVRFVSLIGETFHRDLAPASALLAERTLKDGRKVWAFSRFLSRRAQALKLGLWSYGKNVQHAAGLGFQISDVLQRLRWCVPSCGAVIYTHLGHTEFGQTGDRLGWTPDTYAAFEALAAAYHPDGEEPANSPPWVATTSSLLLHRAIAGALPAHMKLNGDVVEIGAWNDARLELSPASHGADSSRFLHGQCVHVADPGKARVRADGAELATLARSTGGTVTIIDDTAPNPFLLSVNAALKNSENARVILTQGNADWRRDVVSITPSAAKFEVSFAMPPLELAQQWAWMIDVRVDSLDRLAIALGDGRGEYYEASGSERAQWRVFRDTPADAAGWRRLVFEFANRNGHPAGPPQKGISGLRLYSQSAAAGTPIEIKCAALLRPAAVCLLPCPTHWLGGRLQDRQGRPFPAGQARIEVVADGQTTTLVPDATGFFETGGLLRHRVYRVTAVTPGGPLVSAKGSHFAATRDCWDWDVAASG